MTENRPLASRVRALRFRPSLYVALFLFLAVVTEQKANSPTVHESIEYAHIGETPLLLDLHLPEKVDAPALIVWVHGGAWRAGSRKSVAIKDLTKSGWAIASVDYRLSGQAQFPAQIHDIKAAIRYLRANPEGLLYDPTKIVIMGLSAGGHLAALTGVTNNHSELEGTVGNHSDQDSSTQAIVSLFGASNLTTILKQSTPHGLKVRVPALELLLGGQPEDNPDIAQLASPVFHVDPNDPPLLMLHGDQDPQMPINQSHELEGRYRAIGLPCEFVTVYGAAHGGPAFNSPDSLQRIDTFLRSHLAK